MNIRSCWCISTRPIQPCPTASQLSCPPQVSPPFQPSFQYAPVSTDACTSTRNGAVWQVMANGLSLWATLSGNWWLPSPETLSTQVWAWGVFKIFTTSPSAEGEKCEHCADNARVVRFLDPPISRGGVRPDVVRQKGRFPIYLLHWNLLD